MIAFFGSLLLCTLLQGQEPVDPGTSWVFRVEAPAPAAMRALRERFDVHESHEEHRGDGSIVVVVMPEELAGFRGLGLDARLLSRGRPFRDVVREQQRAAGPAAPDANYYTVAEVEAKLAEFETSFPAIARKVNVTALVGGPKTINGHDLFAVKISDNPAADEDEPVVLIAAQHHARELNSPHMVIGAAQRILAAYASDPAIRKIVDEHELWLVPTVNPDGVDHVWNVDENWRKNRRNNGSSFGVDLNRNYPFLWASTCGGSTSGSSETYRGPAAGSEAETQVMMKFGDLKRIEKYLDFHSSGREVLNTYSTCSVPSAPVVALIARYRDELRTPMTYAFRAPSASGEAPEYHWTSSGALSFLVEISTAFQPVWSATVTEEARVWPGIRRFLDFDPALAGHVRSLDRGTPLEAEVVVPGFAFSRGERNVSEKAFGRYRVWLPPGQWAVVFRAAGHRDETVNVTVNSYDATELRDVVMTPSWADATLAKSGSERVGTRVTLDYTSPGDAGLGFFIPIGLGTTPGTPIGTRTLPLNPELLVLSLNLAPILTANLGVLPGSAAVTASFDIPPLQELVGFDFFFAGITFAEGFPLGVKKFSAAVRVTVKA